MTPPKPQNRRPRFRPPRHQHQTLTAGHGRTATHGTPGRELFNRRAALFARRGAGDVQAEAMAERLVRRDREEDDRHICHECRHPRGGLPGLKLWQWQGGGVPDIDGHGAGGGLHRHVAALHWLCSVGATGDGTNIRCSTSTGHASIALRAWAIGRGHHLRSYRRGRTSHRPRHGGS